MVIITKHRLSVHVIKTIQGSLHTRITFILKITKNKIDQSYRDNNNNDVKYSHSTEFIDISLVKIGS